MPPPERAYLTWRDAFEVEFDDGIAFLETHQAIRRANKIKRNAWPVQVKLETQTLSGFLVHYDNGQIAEVSWSFIRELPAGEECPVINRESQNELKVSLKCV